VDIENWIFAHVEESYANNLDGYVDFFLLEPKRPLEHGHVRDFMRSLARLRDMDLSDTSDPEMSKVYEHIKKLAMFMTTPEQGGIGGSGLKHNNEVYDKLIKVMGSPLEDIPLYLGDDTYAKDLASWRLENGI